MCATYLGFVLLACFPGFLHAQDATQPCPAPRLNDGYFVPEQVTYNHERNLTYACNNRHKPAVEGWWATSTCQNGTWSPKPQCIDEEACIAPDIPNANYKVNQHGWYNDGHKIRIKCNKGYEPKDQLVTTTCINGIWDSVPVCEKSIHACGEPPQIPHAVIILQGYQDFFAEETTVQYQCEYGYTVEGAVNKKSVYCVAGNWTEGPVCNAGLGGSAEVGTGGRQTTSAGSGTQSEASRPGTGHGGGATGSGTQSEASKPATGHGGGATSSGTQPASGGTSTTSDQNERVIKPLYTRVTHCGAYPHVPDGDVVEQNDVMLRYQCINFYKHVGSDIVICHSNGSWSQLPICKAAFCSLDPADPVWKGLLSGVEYINEGEMKFIRCISGYYSSLVKCIKGQTIYSQCCYYYGQYYRSERCP